MKINMHLGELFDNAVFEVILSHIYLIVLGMR